MRIGTIERELAGGVGGSELLQHEASEQLREDAHGHEEARLARDPTSWLRICGVGAAISASAKRPRCWSRSRAGSGCGYAQLFGASGKHHGVVERHWLRCESQGSCATRPVVAVALGLSHGAKPSASGSPMPTSNRSAFRLCLERVSATSRTAVYGPVRTVVWEGRSREAPPLSRSLALLRSAVTSSLSPLSREWRTTIARSQIYRVRPITDVTKRPRGSNANEVPGGRFR